MFAHTVLSTDNDIRSNTGGNNLRPGQQLTCCMSSKRRYAYQGHEREPLVWTHSSDNLPYTLGVDTREESDAT